jgi:DnaJ-class molecular chaperone
MSDKKDKKVCPTCGGSSVEHQYRCLDKEMPIYAVRNVQCPTCNGTGEVPAKTECGPGKTNYYIPCPDCTGEVEGDE